MLNDNLNVLQLMVIPRSAWSLKRLLSNQIFATYECEHELQSLSLGFKAIQAYAYEA